MANITAFVRSLDKTKKTNIRFRLRDGRKAQLFYVGEKKIAPCDWDSVKEQVKSRIAFNEIERQEINGFVADTKKLILKLYDERKEKEVTSEWLKEEMEKILHPEWDIKKDRIADIIPNFLEEKQLSIGRTRHYKVLIRSLLRFEKEEKTSVTLANADNTMFFKFENFLRNEHKTNKDVKTRSKNTLIDIIKKLKAVLNWAVAKGLTTNTDYQRYKTGVATYGTPIYITLEERDKIYHTDFSSSWRLDTYRDMFIFQCLVGCRVSDLFSFTKSNIVGGNLCYIAHKTKEERPKTIQVPLVPVALEILEKHKNDDDTLLFDVGLKQDYNEAIKRIFAIAGITRNVVVLNPLTREPETRRICDIASSHLARRTFIGNLYKKVKDPNLVSAFTGHEQGSKAFARYRDIDEEIKKETIKLIE